MQLNTYRSLSIHTGHVDDGAFGLDQMWHTELSKMEDWPRTLNKRQILQNKSEN